MPVEPETSERYVFSACVRLMSLVQEDERYVEWEEDILSGYHHAEEWFDTEAEAVAFVKAEVAKCVAEELDGVGYKVTPAPYGLDTVDYCDGLVERLLVETYGDDEGVIDEGKDPSTEHYYRDGYYECSLPDDVRAAAMLAQSGYHDWLDYDSDGYVSLSERLSWRRSRA